MSKTSGPPSRYIDRPEIGEIFADGAEHFFYGENVVKMTLSSTQWPTPKKGQTYRGQRYPVCRLVLTAKAAVEVYNQLHQFMTVFEQEGLIVKTESGPKTIN